MCEEPHHYGTHSNTHAFNPVKSGARRCRRMPNHFRPRMYVHTRACVCMCMPLKT